MYWRTLAKLRRQEHAGAPMTVDAQPRHFLSFFFRELQRLPKILDSTTKFQQYAMLKDHAEFLLAPVCGSCLSKTSTHSKQISARDCAVPIVCRFSTRTAPHRCFWRPNMWKTISEKRTGSDHLQRNGNSVRFETIKVSKTVASPVRPSTNPAMRTHHIRNFAENRLRILR